MSDPNPLPHCDVFEKHGETGTRFLFAGKEGEIGRAADAWLAELQTLREAECSAKRDAREEETLSIARSASFAATAAAAAASEANTIARSNRRISIRALIVAAIVLPLQLLLLLQPS